VGRLILLPLRYWANNKARHVTVGRSEWLSTGWFSTSCRNWTAKARWSSTRSKNSPETSCSTFITSSRRTPTPDSIFWMIKKSKINSTLTQISWRTSFQKKFQGSTLRIWKKDCLPDHQTAGSKIGRNILLWEELPPSYKSLQSNAFPNYLLWVQAR